MPLRSVGPTAQAFSKKLSSMANACGPIFFVAWVVIQWIGVAQWSVAAAPNIIVLLTDDMGYNDLSCQGSPDIVTPNIDSLAIRGVRCTDAYVSSCMCSPSRAGLLTGRSQSRFGHEINWEGAAKPDQGLPVEEKTIADWLKTAGYRTGIVGKWHLGESAQFHPNKRGFDEFFGFLGGGHRYFCDLYKDPKTVPKVAEYDTLLEENGTSIETSGYLTTVLAQQSVKFIQKNKDNPFFLYVAFNAPHAPVQSTSGHAKLYPNIKDPQRQGYAGMMAAIDDGIGLILKQLQRDGLDDNTLIFFLSDNGGPLERNGSLNTPLDGEKGGMLEGGIRVPFLVRWPAQLPAGKVYSRPVSSLDICATALELAGVPAPTQRPLDGVNLIPYLRGELESDPHEILYWRMEARKIWAVRKGDWKLGRQPPWPDKHVGSYKPRLVHLAEDIAEANDLVEVEKDKAAELQRAYDEWNKTLPAPLW